MNKTLSHVTERIRVRSAGTRERYLAGIERMAARPRGVERMGCANVAHAVAALPANEKLRIVAEKAPHLAVVTSYNDMLSAHQPFETYPALIREAAREAGGVAQVAGGVPAMCDGVTQGQPGMELSLFSRDLIAMAAGVGLSHNMFDSVVYLGVCDKIVPGLTIAALTFGHLPAIFIPAGPMTSGLPNDEKARVRQLYAEGKVGRAELLEAESKSYHGPGTCTFYGTANSNQMLMEIMGFHMPGSAFVHPHDGLRQALTEAAVAQALAITPRARYTPIGRVVDERCIVNAMAALLATGGSTNHLIHWVAVARAAGILIDWSDFAELSAVVPLLARVYPNGAADVNQFQAAGGPGFVIRELMDAGLMHEDVLSINGESLRPQTRLPALAADGKSVAWQELPAASGDASVLRGAAEPFSASGGLKMLTGNIGSAVIKISAVKPERHVIEAPAKVFHDQLELNAAFKAGELTGDFIAVVRFQGPKANGMPELHKLTTVLGILQDRGQKVALLTDGRMSGASGKVPAAIHVTPEALAGGPLARLRDGDLVRLDAVAGTLQALVSADEWAARELAQIRPEALDENGWGMGRELFAGIRRNVKSAEEGAVTWL
ncbi:UNVERIFIED_ORG: phosphogluconate dehydratase [Shinella sp. XGS7]|nr:phosphogluconate dehydratase [Shinella sp. XGS7]